MDVADLTTDLDFFAPEAVANPYPLFEQIREIGPLVYHEPMGVWLVTGYEDIRAVLNRNQDFYFPDDFSAGMYGQRTIVGYDDEHHDKLRAIWGDDFHRGYVQNYAEFVTPTIGGLLDPFVERVRSGETVDIVDAVTRLIPTYVITRLIGLDQTRLGDYAHWIDELSYIVIGALDPDPERKERSMARGLAATKVLIEHLNEAYDERGGEITDDLICRQGPDPDFHLDRDERIANIAGMVFAGYETTSKLLAHITVLLAQHPDQRRILQEDRSLIPGAVEEFLRYTGIVAFLPRRPYRDLELFGVELAADTPMLTMNALANRDPVKWPDPNRLDVTRKPQQHLAFGYGIHLCLGQSLARLEAVTFLNELLDRLPEWELGGEPDYAANWMLRGPHEVQVIAA